MILVTMKLKRAESLKAVGGGGVLWIPPLGMCLFSLLMVSVSELLKA